MAALTAEQQSLLDGLRKAARPGEWVAVAEIFRRQWKALAGCGLIDYRPGGRQHQARIRIADMPGEQRRSATEYEVEERGRRAGCRA